MTSFSCFSKGGADLPEMCSAHHRPGVGACALCAGDGPSAPLHDQEGPHQHWCAGSETASSPWKTLLCECPHLHLVITQQRTSYVNVVFFYQLFGSDLQYLPHFIIFAEERYHHRCRGFGSGCCAAAAKLWHSGDCPWLKLVPVTLLLWPPILPCSLVTVFSLHTLHFRWFTGGGAWGEGENWRSCVGRYFSGRHCRTRGSNCQWLCQQPHRPDVWTGWNLELKKKEFYIFLLDNNPDLKSETFTVLWHPRMWLQDLCFV